MSAKDFKFVSPGVFIEEIDNSQVPKLPIAIGPLVIGRARRGPAYQPVRVDSFSEFVTIFGNPVAGEESSDLWRSGVPSAPTFAAYAAQAWLKNSSPLTFIRLLGDQSPDYDSSDTSGVSAAGWKISDLDTDVGGGAYGLFVFPSASTDQVGSYGAGTPETPTGCLAAIIYTTGSAPALSGSVRGNNTTLQPMISTFTSSCVLIESVNKEFTFQIYDDIATNVYAGETNSPIEDAVISFDRSSTKYIRKVLNTNPTLTNTEVVDSTSANSKKYFVGQTFERAVEDLASCTEYYGLVVRLDRGSSAITNGNDYKFASQHARSGWFFSQDLRATNAKGSNDLAANVPSPQFDPRALNGVTRLFKCHGLTSGEEIHRNFKISIEDLNYSKNDSAPYGTFTLAIRDIKDSDNARKYVERYTNLTLDPSSPNYIAKIIGDMYQEYDTGTRRLIQYGSWPNRSSIVRVEMANAVDSSQVDPESLPFGVEGPVRYRTLHFSSSSGIMTSLGSVATASIARTSTAGSPETPVTAGGPGLVFNAASRSKVAGNMLGSGVGIIVGSTHQVPVPITASAPFPSIPLRASASNGNLSDPTEAYFGAQFTRGSGSSVFDESMYDILYPVARAEAFDNVSDDEGSLDVSWYFTMDDLMMQNTSNQSTVPVVYYASGSRSRGDSITARTGSYKAVIDKGYDRFSAPLYGGFDGFDITEKEPFNHRSSANVGSLYVGATETASAMFYSVKKAIDLFSDPEYIEANLILAPGIRNEGLTTHMINTCEERGDAMAIIDPRGGYYPAGEDSKNEKDRITSGTGRGGVSQHVIEVGDNMGLRSMNSSYGASYYPWVRIVDSITGQSLWAPPSIAAFGAMAYSEKEAALWFAPAGFNRGGLTDGAAGIPVSNVRSKLTSKERDFLYERNINPIASFPNEGIVIFGQKTLQVTPSALDRINVRRLMIFVKKEISRMASNLLFDQNVEQTWSRFTGQVNPFLDNIKNNFGLDGFKVILDESTTTPDMIDRNTIYAKIFLKPTKAVEFFAIDFVITNSGASFED